MTLRNDDVIVTSLKMPFSDPCQVKRDLQYLGHNFDKFKYNIVVIFARSIVKNAKLLTQQKSASPNQCRYFTLRIRQSSCNCKAQSHN